MVRCRSGRTRGPLPHAAARPLTLKSWEAVCFDHDPARVTQLADIAARAGIERFVLDEGCFRGRRNDTAGLGDWTVDPEVWPEGLAPLAERVHGHDMQFCLWVEPEMANPDSDPGPRPRRLDPRTDRGPRPHRPPPVRAQSRPPEGVPACARRAGRDRRPHTSARGPGRKMAPRIVRAGRTPGRGVRPARHARAGGIRLHSAESLSGDVAAAPVGSSGAGVR
ncbi:alpha-galactosidase [Streptomyces sp. NPDC002928]|uniref:alpha-galactosidase n=1 Tax=Streptomyces sp. NPDC002928 TaxID=3154440 RepID=UPI0033AA0760